MNFAWCVFLLAVLAKLSTPTPEPQTGSVPGLGSGMLVMMNSSPKNFLIYDWQDVAKRFTPLATRW